ncbi:LTA synthase family protein [Flavobacterium sp. K5-23]|uniref:LTA synthase family protein n=1 Tax=Flavobacterium sp. K5-23 TaxID=2746225 RepID=UPI00200EA02E|nr:LTA synthase family protein [Flavobacterium sp. K5-23]UQD56432.1 sulfatase-like hydrolase/transferase [Flavobacterium sp. K5-23]
MNSKTLLNSSYSYAYFTASLVITFWLSSLYEIFIISSNGIVIQNIAFTLFYKLTNDFLAGIGIGLLLFPLYFGIRLYKKRLADILIKIVFTLVVLGQFALVKYSLTTLINLGADILGYSMADMYTTVTASESLSVLYFLPFILVPMLFLGINEALKRYGKEKIIIVSLLSLIPFFVILKLSFSESSGTNYQNKMYFFASDIMRFQNDKNLTNVENIFYKKEYPLVKPFEKSEDVLSPFFNIQEDKPNIAMIIVEGLGAEFLDKNAYRGFTPFLDSLISESLYWENFVSNTGRTFGVVPSLLGSLPYAENGFLEQNPLPSHISLISILKSNGYTTSYFSGDESSFDRKINFLEYNEIDNIIDVNKFGPGYTKTKENSGGFSWGYPDAEIFKKTLSELDGKKMPRLDIIMTLTNHEPFDFPSKNVYLKKVDSIMNTNKTLDLNKSEIIAYKDIFACLLYADTSIKNFMKEYAKRPEYKNTIFIITGDHRLIPISQRNKLCRFHVPLIISSPMLKKAEKFKSISSHWDVAPSLVSFLMNNYKFNKMEKTTWMSQGLDTVKEFRNIHNIPLMRNKGSINDFIYKDYLYSDGELFKINENFGINKVNEKEILKTISDTLKEAKMLNAYLTQKNKIIPKSLNIYTQPATQFTKQDLATINKLAKGLNYDQMFVVARDLAFKKEYKNSRLLCDYILNELPNFSDVRILKARTLGWEGDYKKAETELLSVIKRTPFHIDSYLALMDLYWWSDQNEKGILVAQKAATNQVKNPEIDFKLAEAYQRINKPSNAFKIIESLLKTDPKNQKYLTFKNTLKK